MIDLRFLAQLRLLGVVEGTSTLILFGIAMPLKYLAGMPMAVTVVGSIHGALFVAEHGSWNRSSKVGYRVMVGRVSENGEMVDYAPFVSGWLKGRSHWGRPVDFEVMADGSLLISDDYANRIYRVTYQR